MAEEANGKKSSGAAAIAYCGPIAQAGRPARGGYESANRRVIDDLRQRGIAVLELPYPVAEGGPVSKALAYALGFLRIGAALIRNRRRFDILHLTPLYRQFLYGEALLFSLASALGKPVLLDIRAGRFVKLYRERSAVYRRTMDALLRRAAMVAVEGEDYVAFAAERRARPILYLPNYVHAKPAGPAEPHADAGREPVRLVYLGRVVPEKGIEVAIGALRILQAEGLDAELGIIGKGDDAYVRRLATNTADLKVTWHGPADADAVRTLLAGGHFFLFPTRHPGEGHSNALTEAMAEGLVPVCSDQGFNRSVAGDSGRVLPPSATAEDYARAISEIWRGGDWHRLSGRARARVQERFTDAAVLPALIAAYQAASPDRHSFARPPRPQAASAEP
jgi:glycosyltransferase involved in cell wall biosynthesis